MTFNLRNGVNFSPGINPADIQEVQIYTTADEK